MYVVEKDQKKLIMSEKSDDHCNGSHHHVRSLKFKKLSDYAKAPTRGSAQAAGYDLYRLVILLQSFNADSFVSLMIY